MVYFFRSLLLLTISGGAAALLTLLACRAVGQRVSAWCRYAVWILPALLFLLPLPAPLSPLPTASIAVAETAAAPPSQPAAEVAASPQAAPDPVTKTPGTAAAAQSAQTPAQPIPSPPDWPRLLVLLWAAGVAALTLWQMIQVLRFRRFVRRGASTARAADVAVLAALQTRLNMRGQVGLMRFSGHGSPFLAGLVHPVIYLPDVALSPAELEGVLTHELTHCRRLDLLWTRGLWLIRTLHWFNPAAWLMEREAGRYRELACDETVAAPMDREGRRDYGMAILKLMGGPHVPAAPYLAERTIKHRLEYMMNVKKSSILSRVMAIALAIALCLGGGVLAVGLNGTAPAGVYQTEDFTSVSLSTRPGPELEAINSAYHPGFGSADTATGTARLVDRPGEQSFSADIQVADLYHILHSRDYHGGPHHIQVEMTALTSAAESAGIWAGTFTVKRDGETIYADTAGTMTHVPSLVKGEKTGLTTLSVTQSSGNSFTLTMNYGVAGDALVDAAAQEDRIERTLEGPGTRRLSLAPAAGNQLRGEGIAAWDSVQTNVEMNDGAEAAEVRIDLLRSAPGEGGSDAPTGAMPANGSAIPRDWTLSLAQKDVTRYTPGSLSGAFLLRDDSGTQYHSIKGTLSGLDGLAGDTATFRSDDGKDMLRFTLCQTEQEVATYKERRLQHDDGIRGERTMDVNRMKTLLAAGEYDWNIHQTLEELPFAVTYDVSGIHLRYTGPEGYQWTAILYNEMGDSYWTWNQKEFIESAEGIAQGFLPFQGRYRQRFTQADAVDGAVYLPFQSDHGAGTYYLYLGLWSTEHGAAGADYQLEFQRGSTETIAVSCRMRDGLRNTAVPEEEALPLLRQFLPRYLFDANS